MRIPAVAKRLSPDGWATLTIVGVVLIAHAVFLLDLTDPNPLTAFSGLAASVAPGHVTGAFTIDPNIGFTSQALGHRAALDLVHGTLPWWNPDQGTGGPLAGELQSASFFPPTLLLLLGNGQLYEHMLLEIVAGISTYRLLRRLGLTRVACVTGGVAFALNGAFAWFSHATVNPIALLPVVLLGIEHAHDAAVSGRKGGWWLIGVAAALSFYGGFPEITYIDGVMILAWFAWRCGCAGRPHAPVLVRKAVTGGAVAVLLSAPLILATLPFLSHTYLGLHGSGLLGNARFGTDALSQLIMPYVYGPIFGYTDPLGQVQGLWVTVGGYLTMTLLTLAALGLFARGRRGLRLVLLAFLLVTFARMYGQIPLLGKVIGILPGMDRVAFFRYATSALELTVIVLAALGLDDLIRVPEHRRRLVWATVGGLVVVGLGALEAHTVTRLMGAGFASQHYFAIAVAWAALTLLALGALAVFVADGRRRGTLIGVVVGVDVLIMFVAPTLSAPRNAVIDTAAPAYLQRHLGTGRVYTLGPLAPNYGSYFGVALLNNNDFPPQNYASWLKAHLDPYVDPTLVTGNSGGGRNAFAPSTATELLRNLNGYRAAGVSYVITPVAQVLGQSPTGFTLVARTLTTRIYHLAGAAPYFTAPGCSTRANGREEVRLTCAAATTLTRRETYYPGWSATVDGRDVPIHQTDGLFQRVAVRAGAHTVHFDYAPPNIVWGWIAFVAGLLALGRAALTGSATHRWPAARPARRRSSA